MGSSESTGGRDRDPSRFQRVPVLVPGLSQVPGPAPRKGAEEKSGSTWVRSRDGTSEALAATWTEERNVESLSGGGSKKSSTLEASVHAHYTEAIRDAASLPDLYGYLRGKYKWTKETLQTISWSWFKAAASIYHHTGNHIMKLVYNQLPTRYVKNKKSGQPWIPDSCQFCGHEPETFEHLLRCNHVAANEFRKALPRAVRN